MVLRNGGLDHGRDGKIDCDFQCRERGNRYRRWLLFHFQLRED